MHWTQWRRPPTSYLITWLVHWVTVSVLTWRNWSTSQKQELIAIYNRRKIKIMCRPLKSQGLYRLCQKSVWESFFSPSSLSNQFFKLRFSVYKDKWLTCFCYLCPGCYRFDSWSSSTNHMSSLYWSKLWLDMVRSHRLMDSMFYLDSPATSRSNSHQISILTLLTGLLELLCFVKSLKTYLLNLFKFLLGFLN